jgi:nitroreductase
MSIIDSLRWRYATKKFDSSRVLTDAQVDDLLSAGNLTASSYGLQPFKLVVIRDQELQDKLVPHSYQQNQVAEASHVIVISIRTDVDADYIGRYTAFMENERGLPESALDQYKQMMLATVGKFSPEEMNKWSAKQAYIVLGTLLAAAAAMEIDTCPMEGFVPDKYDELLGLSQLNLKSTLVLPIGFRAEDDKNQYAKKIRQPMDEFVVKL